MIPFLRTSALFLLLLFAISPRLLAQDSPAPQPDPNAPAQTTPTGNEPEQAPNRKTTFFRSDYQEKLLMNGEPIVNHVGNVELRQPDKTLFCDKVTEYPNRKMVHFIGNVRIMQNTGSQISGDTLIYYKDARLSNMRGNVVVKDKSAVLTTSELDYNMDNGLAYYTHGAHMRDDKSTLTSEYGEFDRVSHIMYFRRKVHMTGKNSVLDTDTLRYNTETKMAYFYGRTKIVNKEGTLRSTKGQYNTKTEVAKFENRADVETPDYIMIGDVVDYDRENQYGTALGNVIMFSKKDSATIYGDEAEYSGTQHFTKVYGKARLKDPVKGAKGDTLFLAADTLLSTNTNDNVERKTIALHHVQIWKKDLQGIADSLIYVFRDSTIRFFRDPVLWNGGNQITADTIFAFIKDRRIDRLKMRQNSFVISQDTLKNYNQLKGRHMIASFDSSRLRRIDVDGNGQSIYFALEGDTALTGMNKVICSNMVVRFADTLGKNALKTITFIKQPEAIFIPPHEILEPEKRLKGFKWRGTDRPSKESVTGIVLAKPGSGAAADKPKPKQKPKKKPPVKKAVKKQAY
ncbi:MAG: OstA-like protein [Bacteroidota bacterium]